MMQHYFIINPAAGNGKAGIETIPKIISEVKKAGVSYEIHRTVNIGDATRYVSERCKATPAELKRFYACGGDGTVNEVLNGIIGEGNAELAVIPVGTGNDFVRNYGEVKQFMDIASQLEGSPVKSDVLKYEFIASSEGAAEPTSGKDGHVFADTGYAMNMFNMGFDAEVVAKTASLKRKPLMSGPTAYVAGVLSVLSRLKRLPMSVEIDGSIVADGEFLLAGAANGRFSGGGFDGIPIAQTNDGIMDVLLVRSVTRRFFLSIVKKYHDGTHLGDKRLDGVLTHHPCKEAVFRPRLPMTFAIDGETTTVTDVRISIVPSAVTVSLPKGVNQIQSLE